MAKQTDTPQQETDELRKRRERLEALKSKRSGVAAAQPEPAQTQAPAGDATAGLGGMGGGAAAGFGGIGDAGPKRARQRKMLMKVFKVLTQTPEDEHGHVPETPFTESGVARLMDMLRERSADANAPGSKVAGSLLNFVSPSEGESATSSGASVEKLQLLARRVEAMRGKAGGAGRTGAW